MKPLTSKILKKAGACKEQVALFIELGGDEKTITAGLCIKHAEKFDWGWAANNLLKPKALAEYERVRDVALAEYDRAVAPALAQYKRVGASAWAEYERASASAWAEYKRVRDVAWAEYKRVRDVAWAEYQRVQASAFWAAYTSEANQ